MSAPRVCEHCRNAIPSTLRRHARFCSSTCRLTAREHRRARARRSLHHYVRDYAPDVLAFGDVAELRAFAAEAERLTRY